jgi:hypothetical protein
MEESEGAGSDDVDDVDCIRAYVCSLCPHMASARRLSAYTGAARSPVAGRVDQDPSHRTDDRRGAHRIDAIALAPMTKMQEGLC